MAPADGPILTFRIDQIRVLLVHLAHKSVAAADRQPIFVESPTVLADSWSTPGSVILKSADYPIRILGTDRDVIELANCGRIDMVPIDSSIVGHIETSVSADDHMTSVAWIDPKIVAVGMHTASEVAIEGNAAVLGFELRYAQDINAICVVRVNLDDAEVHRPRVERIHADPRLTAIVGTIHSTVFSSLGSLHVLDIRGLAEIRIGVRAIIASTVSRRHCDLQLFRVGTAKYGNLYLVPRLEFSNRGHKGFVVCNGFAAHRLHDIVGLQASFLSRSIGRDFSQERATGIGVVALNAHINIALCNRSCGRCSRTIFQGDRQFHGLGPSYNLQFNFVASRSRANECDHVVVGASSFALVLSDHVRFFKTRFFGWGICGNSSHHNFSIFVFSGDSQPNASLCRLGLLSSRSTGESGFQSERLFAPFDLDRDFITDLFCSQNRECFVEVTDRFLAHGNQLIANFETGFFSWAFGHDLRYYRFTLFVRSY